jgi:steroid delta-isomerase-like uncharacterized protein
MNSTEANRVVVRRYIEEVINQGQRDLIDTFFAPEMREQVRGFLSNENDPFPDAQESIQDIVAEGNKVMVRWLFRGTHRGEFMGIPATGKRIEITGYGTYYLENGHIIWDTMLMDWLDALEQLGATISV